ncbi:MAG: alpha/beta hydrolase family protein [Burkholderiaceae bacterium]
MLVGLPTASLARAAGDATPTVAAAVLPPVGTTPEIAVFYAGIGPAQDIVRDGVRMQMGWDLPAVESPGKRPLVVLSHGSGGNPWQLSDLAKRLVQAGFVVAAPFHPGDNNRDHDHSTLTTWTNWQMRPTHLTAAIDAMARSGRWQVRTDKVGVYGMSAGGHTALAMAGGKWSADNLRRHCNQHIRLDFKICTEGHGHLKGDWLDNVRIVRALASINYRMRDTTVYGHADPRVAAVVAEVPALAEFDMATLVSSNRAIGVVQALADQFIPPDLHSGALLRACRHCVELASVPGAGHLSLLSPPVPPEASTDAPGFDRRVVVDVQLKVVAFFVRHLSAGAVKVGKT